MICFQISIFEPLETTWTRSVFWSAWLWFAFKLVSLNHWKQPIASRIVYTRVVICFQISIFEPLETTKEQGSRRTSRLWFAFKLVSLNHWKQLHYYRNFQHRVVICFQISIFEPLETTHLLSPCYTEVLWFAFKLVSLNHWKQLNRDSLPTRYVVICFQISIFEPLETTIMQNGEPITELWFAFKLVSLNHWKQHVHARIHGRRSCDLLSN